MNLNRNTFSTLTFGLLGGVAIAASQGCDDIADKCGLGCEAKGVAEGNASITGVASIDAFFGAVVDLKAAAATVNGNVRAELDAIAISLDLKPGAAAADISAAIEAKLEANVSGGLKIEYQEPKCSASVEVMASAAAECDADVEPGKLSVECEGTCKAEASAEVECEADVEVACEGTAPGLECEGSCTGSCNLEVAAECSGTCTGTCSGECSVEDANGNCNGACMGECEGTCQLEAGGECSGKCEGSCEWTQPDASCGGSASGSCKGSADASVECSGKCEGEAKPPKVKAECEASVEAKADAQIECTPPAIDVRWQWHADLQGDLDAQAEFKAWVTGFKGHFSALLAASAKAEILIDGFANIAAAAEGAVEGALEEIEAEGDFAVAYKATKCGLPELKAAGKVIGEASGSIKASFEAVAEIGGAVGR